ncbi:MAG TPA: polysaccharide biosynthesis tyrosine autokinase [Anaerolineae bacterium]
METKRYLGLFWRWGWLLLLGTVGASVIAFLLSQNMAPVYRASSRLLIDEAPGSAGDNDYSLHLLEQRLAQTYVEIINTHPIRQETVERLNLPFAADVLAAMLSVSALPDTKIIVVSVEDVDPERAADIANTISEVFISQNQTRESLRYAEPIANWQARIDQVGDEIQALKTQLNAFGPAETAEELAALSRLETQLDEAQIRYTEAFNNLNELEVAQARESSNVVQVERAQPARTPIRPRIMTNTILAAAAGAMIAFGVAFSIENLDNTIRTPEEVLQAVNLATLGAIAFIKGTDPSSRLVTASSPRDPISEAYRVLRTNLSFSASGDALGTILLTSPTAGEGKSTTVANLAVVLAQADQRVIVVDADLRRPVQHEIFKVSNKEGLTTALTDDKVTVSDHLQKTRIPGLAILTSGPIPSNPAELLGSPRMVEVLTALREEADVIVLDCPPTLTVADASILASRVDGCLLVVEINKTRRATLVQTVERLQKAQATLFGAVMNQPRPGRGVYTYYYYHTDRSQAIGQRARRGFGTIQARLPDWPFGLNKR